MECVVVLISSKKCKQTTTIRLDVIKVVNEINQWLSQLYFHPHFPTQRSRRPLRVLFKDLNKLRVLAMIPADCVYICIYIILYIVGYARCSGCVGDEVAFSYLKRVLSLDAGITPQMRRKISCFGGWVAPSHQTKKWDGKSFRFLHRRLERATALLMPFDQLQSNPKPFKSNHEHLKKQLKPSIEVNRIAFSPSCIGSRPFGCSPQR